MEKNPLLARPQRKPESIMRQATVKDLSRFGESLRRHVKLALLNPTRPSTPHAVISVAKAERSGRYYFWDSAKNSPFAPPAWPQGQNIPLGFLHPSLTDSRRQHGQVFRVDLWASHPAVKA